MSAPSMPYVSPLIASIADIGEGALRQAQDGGALAHLTNAAYEFCDAVTRDLMIQQPPPQSLACGQGCWHCCISPRVEALPIEVLVIARHLSTHTVPPVLAELMEIHQGEDAPNFTAPHRTCPLLHDTSCAIYAVRPFVCRSFNAYDSASCAAKKLEGAEVKILGYAHQGLTYQAALTGLAQACTQLKLSAELVDLPSALALALKDVEGYTQRWLKGEDIFPAT